jgi:AcrR family transcriptional regulator
LYHQVVPTRARERLLEVADQLFYAEGIRAVGIDRILEVSGVGKASLYRHFASKDELVVAVLRRRDEHWRAWLAEAVETLGSDAEYQPLAVFDALAERFARRDFRGCAFINTMVETADPNSPAYRAAAEHKERLTSYVDRLLREAGHADHEMLAGRLVLLIDGAIVTSLRERTAEAAAQAKEIARVVLDAPAANMSKRDR